LSTPDSLRQWHNRQILRDRKALGRRKAAERAVGVDDVGTGLVSDEESRLPVAPAQSQGGSNAQLTPSNNSNMSHIGTRRLLDPLAIHLKILETRTEKENFYDNTQLQRALKEKEDVFLP
jgi:hypothetical protein